MRRRDNSRLCSRLPRISLPLPVKGLGPHFGDYVNRAITPQVIFAVVVVLVMVVAVSGGIAVLTGSGGQGGNTEKQLSSSPPPGTSFPATDQSATSLSPGNRLPLEQYVTHTGETIASIASATGRSTETLIWANSISEPDAPLPARTQLSVPPLDGLLHLVQPGNTLEGIAEAVEAKPEDITGYAPNQVARDEDLVPGQLILIPGASVQSRERILSYDVRPGDTVQTIAGRFGLEPSAILSANEMPEPNLIYAGQALIIPPPDSMIAEVQPGDSLVTLASRWGADPVTIAEYPGNGISDPDNLVAGQSLIIPVKQASGPPATADTATAGTANADNSPKPDSANSDPTTGRPAGDSRKQAETTVPGVPAPAPEQTPPAAEPETTQQPAATPLPEAEALTLPQPSPAITSNAPSNPLSSSAHPLGNFIWPAKGTISQHFGPTSAATDPSYDGYPHFHTGLDIANDAGTPVVAADEGTIAFAGWSADGLGYTVKIDHGNGFVTWYGHLAEPPSVTDGEQVGKGQFLGPMGNTGNSTGPLVYFSVVHAGTYLNPTDHLP